MAKYDNPRLKEVGYFPVGRVAGVVGKHRTTLIRLVRTKEINGQKDGQGWYIFVPSLIDYFTRENAHEAFASDLRKLIEDGKREVTPCT